MADDEQYEGTQDEDTEAAGDESKELNENEARKAMEDAKRKHKEKMDQEMAEYEEMRRAEREKEADEIQRLREKRIQRKKEREEEEKRLAEMRVEEDRRRKAEDEERRRKKMEEERRQKEERERKRKEAEERMKPKKPNYVITKKEGAERTAGEEQQEASFGKEHFQKSKEQLEEEKRAILAQRINPLNVEGFNTEKLIEKAKELHELIRRLEGDKYDLEQRFKRQQYDMIELAERARQMNKGKGKRGQGEQRVEEGPDKLSGQYPGAPAKIQLCSKYERHTDHRTYDERKDLFEDLGKEPPPIEIKRRNPDAAADAGEAPPEEAAAAE